MGLGFFSLVGLEVVGRVLMRGANMLIGSVDRRGLFLGCRTSASLRGFLGLSRVCLLHFFNRSIAFTFFISCYLLLDFFMNL
jgi:hypothetical protein